MLAKSWLVRRTGVRTVRGTSSFSFIRSDHLQLTFGCLAKDPQDREEFVCVPFAGPFVFGGSESERRVVRITPLAAVSPYHVASDAEEKRRAVFRKRRFPLVFSDGGTRDSESLRFGARMERLGERAPRVRDGSEPLRPRLDGTRFLSRPRRGRRFVAKGRATSRRALEDRQPRSGTWRDAKHHRKRVVFLTRKESEPRAETSLLVSLPSHARV